MSPTSTTPPRSAASADEARVSSNGGSPCEQAMGRGAAIARDAAYVAVGFGVLAFQKAQVRRRELSDRYGDQLGEARRLVATATTLAGPTVRAASGPIERLEQRCDAAIEVIVDLLPEPLGSAAGQAHRAAQAARHSVRARVFATV